MTRLGACVKNASAWLVLGLSTVETENRMSSTEKYMYGVSQFTTTPWSFEQDVERYAALGVDAIEVCEFKVDPARAAEQMAMVAAHGLTVSSVQPGLHSPFLDAPRTEPIRLDERMMRYRKSIDAFAKLAPGTTFVTITGAAPGYDFAAAFESAVREFRLLADYAADHGVRIALEPLNPIFMNAESFIWSIPDALRIIEAVDRPSLGLWLDVYHVFQDGAAPERIAALGDRLFGVHVNDWRTPREFGDRFVVADGEIDMAPLLAATRKAGYKGAYTLEIFSSEGLEGSLWRGDLSAVILGSRRGLDAAWAAAR